MTQMVSCPVSPFSRFESEKSKKCSLSLASFTRTVFSSRMKQLLRIVAPVIFLSSAAYAASKPHVVTLGRWSTISLPGPDSKDKPLPLKIRPLYVDGRAKEFTMGPAHDVTERTFVVRRIYRVNDSLPQQAGPAQWQWQRGGWLLVDRLTGKVQSMALPEFDPDSSAVNWFRDYAAYCGLSDDGGKVFAVIMQISRRKPLLKKSIGGARDSQPYCAMPTWERNPVRVTFAFKPDQTLTFAVKDRAVDAISPDESDGTE